LGPPWQSARQRHVREKKDLLKKKRKRKRKGVRKKEESKEKEKKRKEKKERNIQRRRMESRTESAQNPHSKKILDRRRSVSVISALRFQIPIPIPPRLSVCRTNRQLLEPKPPSSAYI